MDKESSPLPASTKVSSVSGWCTSEKQVSPCPRHTPVWTQTAQASCHSGKEGILLGSLLRQQSLVLVVLGLSVTQHAYSVSLTAVLHGNLVHFLARG